MNSARVYPFTVFENGGGVLMADVTGVDGTAITQATISAITCKVYDVADPSSATSEPAVVVATSIFDAYQTDARWNLTAEEASNGYNFLFAFPVNTFPDPNVTYQVEFMFTPTSGVAFPIVARGDVIELFSV